MNDSPGIPAPLSGKAFAFLKIGHHSFGGIITTGRFIFFSLLFTLGYAQQAFSMECQVLGLIDQTPQRYSVKDFRPSSQWEQNRLAQLKAGDTKVAVAFDSQQEFAKWAAGAANHAADNLLELGSRKIWSNLVYARRRFSEKMKQSATADQPWLEDPALVGFPRRWEDLLPVEDSQWSNPDLLKGLRARMRGPSAKETKLNRYTTRSGATLPAGGLVRRGGKINITFASPPKIEEILNDAHLRIDHAVEDSHLPLETRLEHVAIAIRGILMAQPSLKGVASCTDALAQGAILSITGRTIPSIENLNLLALSLSEAEFVRRFTELTRPK